MTTLAPETQIVDLSSVILIASLNPLVMAAGLWLGYQADSRPKIVIAGFAAGVMGMALIWLAATLRLSFIFEPGRAAAGMFVIQFVLGMVWASLGFAARRWRKA